MNTAKLFAALAVVAWLAPATPSHADEFPSRWVDAPHESGVHENPGSTTNLAWSVTLDASGAPWLRVEFGACNLGAGSYLRIISEVTRRSHRLNATSLAQWRNVCGALKGDRVTVELHVAPGDVGVFAKINRLLAGLRADPRFIPATLCGADSRINTRDDRVGRMFGGGCTAWLIQNGAVLSAGHCVDGGIGGSFFEVNVPLSESDGTPNPALPEDQFPMLGGSQIWELIGETGRDWGIFNIGPNANTGERAHVGRGFIRITQAVPALNTTLRITGYGNDDGVDYRVEQTSTGPFVLETTDGAQVAHTYRVDTEPANSGSPIIWRIGTVDFSIGIHTDGGCTETGGANSGTSFNQQNLATTVNTWPAATVRYLDTVSAIDAVTGSIFRPYRNFNAAYSGTPSGGTLVLVAGSHPLTTAGNTGTWGSGQTKSITLRAPVGSVTIGN